VTDATIPRVRVTIHHRMRPFEVLAPDALKGVIGKPISVQWPGGPSKALIADAQVVEDGHAANITLEVTGELAKYIEERLCDYEISYFSVPSLGDGLL
jgi:hypothetical protein